jgi:hypothetical protein
VVPNPSTAAAYHDPRQITAIHPTPSTSLNVSALLPATLPMSCPSSSQATIRSGTKSASLADDTCSIVRARGWRPWGGCRWVRRRGRGRASPHRRRARCMACPSVGAWNGERSRPRRVPNLHCDAECRRDPLDDDVALQRIHYGHNQPVGRQSEAAEP